MECVDGIVNEGGKMGKEERGNSRGEKNRERTMKPRM